MLCVIFPLDSRHNREQICNIMGHALHVLQKILYPSQSSAETVITCLNLQFWQAGKCQEGVGWDSHRNVKVKHVGKRAACSDHYC